MKRRLITICVCLLLGTIVNVAVAWGCAILVAMPPQSRIERGVHMDAHVQSKLFVDTNDAFGSTAYWFMRDLIPPVEEWGLSDDLYSYLARRYDAEYQLPTHVVSRVPSAEASVCVFRGWPCKSLWYWGEFSDEWTLHGALSVSLGSDQPRRLPILPIWPGFAINAVFYAAVLWLLLTGPGRLRRFLRLRRGLCPACAYDLRGRGRDSDSSICPECGKNST